jgi:hypothetical protein
VLGEVRDILYIAFAADVDSREHRQVLASDSIVLADEEAAYFIHGSSWERVNNAAKECADLLSLISRAFTNSVDGDKYFAALQCEPQDLLGEKSARQDSLSAR